MLVLRYAFTIVLAFPSAFLGGHRRAGELRAKYDSVMVQLQELEQEQSRQVALVASLAQQRDMYRALVVQKNIKLPPVSSERVLPSVDPKSRKPVC